MQNKTTKLAASWLSNDEAAEHLRLSPNTIRNWRRDGQGPRHHNVGRRVIYKVADLDAFAALGASRVIRNLDSNTGISH